MLGAWPEWGEEEQKEKVVQALGQPAAGWTKAESLLGGGKVPLRTQKQRMENGLLFSLPVLAFLGFFVTSTLQPELPPRANFASPDFSKFEGGDKGKDIAEDIFQLEVWTRKSQWEQRIGSLLRLLRMQLSRWKDKEELTLVEDSTVVLQIDQDGGSTPILLA